MIKHFIVVIFDDVPEQAYLLGVLGLAPIHRYVVARMNILWYILHVLWGLGMVLFNGNFYPLTDAYWVAKVFTNQWAKLLEPRLPQLDIIEVIYVHVLTSLPTMKDKRILVS